MIQDTKPEYVTEPEYRYVLDAPDNSGRLSTNDLARVVDLQQEGWVLRVQ